MLPPDVESDLSEETRRRLRSDGHGRELAPGELLFRQGDPTSSVALVTRGHLKLTAVGSSGRSVLVTFWGPGDFAGHVTAINGTTRLGTAAAMGTAAVTVIPVDRFTELLSSRADLEGFLVRQLAAWAEAAVRAQCAQSTEPAAVRIARLLGELSSPREGSDPELRFELSQDELGQIVGASRESVARVLRDFRSNGLVSTGRRQITVHRLDRLRELAHLPASDAGLGAERVVRVPVG